MLILAVIVACVVAPPPVTVIVGANVYPVPALTIVVSLTFKNLLLNQLFHGSVVHILGSETLNPTPSSSKLLWSVFKIAPS